MSYDIAETTVKSSTGWKPVPRVLRLGLFGFGVVGTGVLKILDAKRDEFRRRFGVDLEVAGICVRELDKVREVAVDRDIVTDRADELLQDESIDVVL